MGLICTPYGYSGAPKVPWVATTNTLSIASGTYTNGTTSSASVPTGAVPGDLLILLATNGSANATLPSGFTSLYSTKAGVIGWRTMVSGDSSFTLPQSDYATVFAVHGSSAHPSVDVFENTALITTSETAQCPAVTPTGTADLAFMLWLCPDAAMTAPAPALTNLISYDVDGSGTCGMAISYQALTSAASVTGDSCGMTATTAYPGVAATLLVK